MVFCMKRTMVAFFMSILILLPIFGGCSGDQTTSDALEAIADSLEESAAKVKQVVLRFAAMSDTHFDGTSSQIEYKRFEQAMDFMYSYSSEQEYKNFDALIVAGDMTNNGYENQLKAFASAVDSKLQDSTQKVFIMGNHEYYNDSSPADAQTLWETTLSVSKNTHLTINGYHFIGVSLSNTTDYTYISSWLDTELAKAATEDPNKPIFVTQHYHITDTVYGSDVWGTPQLTTVLNKYPQVVDFSGHSHYPVNDPRSINQKNFTSLGCGTLSYFELESGMAYGTIPPNANNAAQFYVVEVYSDSSIAFKPYDLITKQFFPTEYTIDNPSNKDNFKYTDARFDTADKPEFEEGTTLNITNINDGGCTLSFKQATDDENMHSYRFDFYLTSDNSKALSLKIWSDFYFLNKHENMTFAATGLTSGTEYKVTVTAIDSYGKESEKAIEATFKTTGEAPAPFDPNAPIPDADVLDIVFNSSGAKDEGSLSKTIENFNAKIEIDSKLSDAYVAKFNGTNEYMRIKFTSDDYSKYNKKITVASKIMINAFPSTYSDAFANMQSGGYGFEINGSTKQIEFWISINGTYKTVAADIKEGQYYSLAGTYDGSAVKLYIDGKLAGSAVANGPITYTATTAAYAFCIGSDVNSEGTGEAFFNGNVAYAKVYSNVLTAEQISNLSKK